jgi:hypothetical protein
VSRQPDCPPWCAAHSEAAADLHCSRHDRISLGDAGHGFVEAYAAGYGDELPAVSLSAVVPSDPRTSATIWIENPEEAQDLALLVEWLERATPGQRRRLAEQIRAAAKIVAEVRDDILRTTLSEDDS